VHLNHLFTLKSNKFEKRAKISTLLTVLGTLAEECPPLVREAVTGILFFVHEINIPSIYLERVIGWLALKKYPNLDRSKAIEEYLGSMLGFILKEFLRQSKLEDFPRSLMNCLSVQDFLLKYESVIVPLLLWASKSKENVLEELAKLTGKSKKALITDNHSQIVAYILPFQTSSEEDGPENAIISKAAGGREKADRVLRKCNLINKAATGAIGIERYNDLLNIGIPEVLSHVFQGIFDPESLNQIFGIDVSLMRPNPPFCSQALAECLIGYFSKIVPSIPNGKLFTYLVSLIPDCIQRLLHVMCSLLRQAEPVPDPHLRALHGIYMFLDYFSQEAKGLANQLPFIIWLTSNTLLNTLETSAFSDVRKCACIVLQKVIELATENQVPETNQLLVVPVRNAAIQILQTERDSIVMSSLVIVVKRLFEKFRSEMEKLGPMSKAPESILQEFAESLPRLEDVSVLDTMDTFIAVSKVVKHGYMENCLENLLDVLTTKKQELSTLMKYLQSTKGLSEDAQDSPVHQLICELISLSSSGNRIAMLASQCLGEIGPSNLGTLVLQSESVIIADPRKPFSSYVPRVIEWLLDYVVSSDNKSAEVASKAIKSLMVTAEFDGEISEKLKWLSIPFQSQNSDKKMLALSLKSIEIFSVKMNDPEIWIRNEDKTHEIWIKDLVTKILSTLDERCCYYSLLGICSLQPKFCEKLLPILVHELLHLQESNVRNVLSRNFQEFFKSHFETCFNAQRLDNESLSPDLVHVNGKGQSTKTLNVMLSVVQHLRHQRVAKTKMVWDQNFWLILNYLHVAQAALTCSAYFSAIQFVDIWCQTYRKENE
jgi:hypothetical protein